jgi:UDP-N-acetylglucosamine 2-epimerase
VRATVHEVFENLPAKTAKRIFLTKPLDYASTLWLLKHSWLVLTDSGGIQEEAACMNAPVLVLRETTERPELIFNGGGMLVGTDTAVIAARVRRLLKNPKIHEAMRNASNPFGDGHAASRICDIIARDGFLS